MKLLLLLGVIAVWLSASSAELRKFPPCEYYDWTDRRGFFDFCVIKEVSLSAIHQNDTFLFTGLEDSDGKRIAVRSVKFENCFIIDFFPEDAIYEAFPKLDGLIVQKSSIPRIKKDMFGEKFESLKFLEMQENDIRDIHKLSLQYMHKLEWVRFASNQITHINENIFEYNRNLKYIDFRNNLIKSITPNLCNGCKDLEQVAFSNRNVCTQKDFRISDNTMKDLEKDLKICFDNCENTGKCDGSPDTEEVVCGFPSPALELDETSKEIKRGRYPWMAAIYYKNQFTCGGNLISKKHILTTAACLSDKGGVEKANAVIIDFHVMLGKFDLGKKENLQSRNLLQRFVLSPSWSTSPTSNYDGDIALACLLLPVTFNDYIRPVCLNSPYTPLENYIASNDLGTVTGWGAKQGPMEWSEQPKEISVPLVSAATCLKTNGPVVSGDSSFCAGKLDGNGPCHGDRGSGLLVKRDNQWTLAGVISDIPNPGKQCDKDNYAVLTDVAKHNQWILSIVCAENIKFNRRSIPICSQKCHTRGKCASQELSSGIDNSLCGIQAGGLALIHHGNEFKRGKWPWLAALLLRKDDEQICGGNLISRKHIITAAHCLLEKGSFDPPLDPEDAYFFLGKYDLKQKEKGELKVYIERFVMHHDWSPEYATHYKGDIAIAFLTQLITFTEFIRPICLNVETVTIEDLIGDQNNYGIVTGWGYKEGNTGRSDKAREIRIPIVHHLECIKSDESFKAVFTEDSSFCAGLRNGSAPCTGDSGGGMYIKTRGEKGSWTLVGITSASLISDTGCNTREYAVFTDVGKYHPWILSQIF